MLLERFALKPALHARPTIKAAKQLIGKRGQTVACFTASCPHRCIHLCSRCTDLICPSQCNAANPDYAWPFTCQNICQCLAILQTSPSQELPICLKMNLVRKDLVGNVLVFVRCFHLNVVYNSKHERLKVIRNLPFFFFFFLWNPKKIKQSDA